MRRGIFSGNMTAAVRAVEREYELFKYRTLSKSREEIFEDCDRIRFYSCIYEYFLYAEAIEEAHLKACLNCGDIMGTLYRLYMKYEYLRYSRWEDIEGILNVLVREQEDGRTASF